MTLLYQTFLQPRWTRLTINALRGSTTRDLRFLSTRNRLFEVSEEVQEALNTGRPVVALETTIYTHGFPYPENVALASHLESLVRVHGGVPATIGIIEGKARVGMDPEQLIQLISTAGSKDTWKISRRDLAFIGGLSGLRGQKLNGGTTIAGTMILAHLAGIKIFATGGLGGVHRGGENSMDISADLTELGRTPVAVVSSGCKSFLDIPRTLEYLETQGVGVGTFADGRNGEVDFPAFFCRDSGVKSPQTVQSEADAAAVVHAQFQLPVHSGLLFANPVPEHSAMEKSQIDSIIAQAVKEADDMGISGSKNTPYILKRIRELSNNGSVVANKALIEANVIRGTKVAAELARLEAEEHRADKNGGSRIVVPELDKSKSALHTPITTSDQKRSSDILVIGSIATDISCDYAPFNQNTPEILPTLHTSNPAKISSSGGGVGRNVATAAQYFGAQVSLVSIVANDLAGQTLLRELADAGISTCDLRVLEASGQTRTAQYVAINDIKRDLMLAMGDFTIFEQPQFEEPTYWAQLLVTQSSKPKWIVVDGNWSTSIIMRVLQAAQTNNIPVAFEPVSTVKAARLFHVSNKAISGDAVLPNNVLSLATPNKLELASMHKAAQTAGLFESEAWWTVIDAFGLSSAGSRDKFSSMLGPDLVDQGLPQQIIQLLPFVPNLITKLGSRGSFLAMVLRKGDPRLTDPRSAPYILSRSNYETGVVGGIYMRLFPPAETVKQEDIVSVNGVGDTLLGVTIAGLIADTKAGKLPRLEEIIPLAQKAAVLTLRSSQAVSPDIKAFRMSSISGRSTHQEI